MNNCHIVFRSYLLWMTMTRGLLDTCVKMKSLLRRVVQTKWGLMFLLFFGTLKFLGNISHETKIISVTLHFGRYISDPPEVSTYWAYRCCLKTTGGRDFIIDLKPEAFKSFDKVQASLVKQTFGEALMTPSFDPKLWTDLVTNQVFKLQSSSSIKHFRVARNTELQFEYLLE